LIGAVLRLLADNSDPRSLSSRLRRRRFQWFLATLAVKPGTTILDVGGTEATWRGSGLEDHVTLLNLAYGETRPALRHVTGDACAMTMFADGAFDVVFSNSVIEHVGDLDRQAAFASEVARVGQRYWVETPYRHFPLEPHALFPFFQYLPRPTQLAVARRWKYSHFRRYHKNIEDELARLRLLTAPEMRRLFPRGPVRFERIGGLPKSIVAYRA
jgi:hypothetical protein